MTGKNSGQQSQAPKETTWTGPRKRWVPIAVLAVSALVFVGLTWVLTTIVTHKQEAKAPFTLVTELNEKTYDPKVWGQNFPLQYESHKATADQPEDTRVKQTPTAEDPREFVAASKIEADPRLVTMWQGYAFSKDYRRPRGHEYMMLDQQLTLRTRNFKQPGACLNCHVSLPEVMDELGNGDRMAGWHKMNAMTYKEASKYGKGPVGCIDCHDPKTMQLRVTRPAFMEGMKALKASQGIKDYDVNRDASTQEMRTFVCAQCHVEYYMTKGDQTLIFPWKHGLTVYDEMKYYDEVDWTDFKHKDTGAKILKAQHPDFETWAQGIHAANGVGCADCHMPYERNGAAKVTNHQIKSPMRDNATINATCLTCHHSSAEEMKGRVDTIQKRWEDAKNVSFKALDDLIKDLKDAIASGKVDEATLNKARDYQRKAQFIIDYTVSENSHGFHAPAYSIAIINQSTDWSQKGRLVLRGVDLEQYPGPKPVPATKS